MVVQLFKVSDDMAFSACYLDSLCSPQYFPDHACDLSGGVSAGLAILFHALHPGLSNDDDQSQRYQYQQRNQRIDTQQNDDGNNCEKPIPHMTYARRIGDIFSIIAQRIERFPCRNVHSSGTWKLENLRDHVTTQ